MPNERMAQIWDVVVAAARRIVDSEQISEAELDAAGAYLEEIAKEGQLVDLLQLVCQTVASDQQVARRTNPNAQVLGPAYKEGAPIKADGVLYDGVPAPGDSLLRLSGRVVDRDTGVGVPGAELDFWHAKPDGAYDFDGYDQRGVVVTDADGAYTVETLVPGIYKTHDGNSVDRLLELMGRTTHRARHIHVKVRLDGKELLTTQFFDPASPYLDSDMLAGAVRPELLAQWREVPGPDDGHPRYEATYDIPVRVS